MNAWHVDDELAGRYASGLADLGLAASLEAHVLLCSSCRGRLMSYVPVERLASIWTVVSARLEESMPVPDDAMPLAVGITASVRRVLRALLEDPAADRYGLELAGVAGLSTGTVYPILSRLEQAGWVGSRWEDPPVYEEARRPRRRLYWITPEGAEQARAALAAARGKSWDGRFGWTGAPAIEGGQA